MRTIVFVAALVAGCHHQPKPAKPAPATATLSGRVELLGGTPCKDPAAGPQCAGRSAEGYEVIVLAKDGKTEVGRTKVDAQGNYTIQLPPGEYTIMTPNGANPGQRRNDVKLETTATLDLHVDSGIR